MPRRPRKKPDDRYHHGDLRAALLEAAVEVLRERGVQGASLRECARRAGVSHAAPYRHFESKDALLTAVAGQGFAWLHAAGAAAMEGVSDPRDRLDAYGVAYVRFAMEHPEHFRVMFTSELPEGMTDATDQAAADAAFELLRAQAAAVVGPGEDDEVAALAFWSLVHGLSLLILDGRVPAERVRTSAQVEALTRATFAHWRAD
ncbi:MAG TPA: TetR/AcrR family transcriptional regulator [Sandaracinaceae bacterium LLY-WYZ-13_1]|nr:TetR/AcrR family transcriptional regulator [Sandaracinaceae bacterium LLY-WYZ-13_1]